MKKLIFGAVIALSLGAASCSKSGDASDAKFFSAEATDSLLMSLGQAAGYGLNMQISQAMAADSTVSKSEFLKGLQYGLGADTTDTYTNGVITGLQIMKQVKYFEKLGIKVDKNIIIDNFKEAFMTDSLPNQIELTKIEAQYRAWNDSLMRAKRAYDRAQLEAAPEAQENAEKGANYIKAMKAQNDSVKETASGLAYKIIAPGEGPKAEGNNRVTLKYTARTAGGQVIDQVSGMPVNLASRPAGLKEGVSMLGKGGKAVLYVPGKLAYGVEAPQGINIGPNELVIYEVEVIDIPTGSNIPAPTVAAPVRR